MTPDAIITSGLLELYITGQISNEEKREVEKLAFTNPDIREELERIEQALIIYASTGNEERAETVKNRIIDRVLSYPLPQEVIPEPPQPKKEVVASPKPAKIKVPKEKNERTVYVRKFNPFIPAFIVAVLALGGMAFYILNTVRSYKIQISNLESTNEQLQQKIEGMGDAQNQLANKLNVFQNPDYDILVMQGMDKAPSSKAMLFWNQKEHRVYVSIQNLPSPPQGMQYQLWAIDNSNMAFNLGTIKMTASKNQLQPMRKVLAAKEFAVTLEKNPSVIYPDMDNMYLAVKI